MNRLILKFIWICKGSRKAKTNLKKNEVAELTPPDFKTYYRVTINNIVWQWQRETYSSVEKDRENRECRNRPKHKWPIDF